MRQIDLQNNFITNEYVKAFLKNMFAMKCNSFTNKLIFI